MGIKILILFFTCIIHQEVESVTNPCAPGLVAREDKNRNPICCYSALCKPGQLFELCQEDGGYDTCQNCPKGYTHYDTIDTALFNSKINPCEEEDNCVGHSDLKLIDGVCTCDRTNGYYGMDNNLCGLDDGSCKKAGHQLTIDGICEECIEDFFKPEISYDLCRKKTSCGSDHEEDNPGSSSRDRTCRQVKQTVSPEKEITKQGQDEIENEENKFYGEVKNTTENRRDADVVTTPSAGTSGESTNIIPWVVIGVIAGLIFIVVLFHFAYKCYDRRKRKGQNDTSSVQTNNSFIYIVCCHNPCSREINVTVATNANIGDNNFLKIDNNDEIDSEVEEDASLNEECEEEC
ncbi:NGFR [Mytilus coruscus]|uniref:NGFR n=1 Tax=Mytilus coruscus TaxID=42192 RepID=A0A6J8BS03_MYTCO|nr:NGFR [Mytilus coruscus]